MKKQKTKSEAADGERGGCLSPPRYMKGDALPPPHSPARRLGWAPTITHDAPVLTAAGASGAGVVVVSSARRRRDR